MQKDRQQKSWVSRTNSLPMDSTLESLCLSVTEQTLGDGTESPSSDSTQIPEHHRLTRQQGGQPPMDFGVTARAWAGSAMHSNVCLLSHPSNIDALLVPWSVEVSLLRSAWWKTWRWGMRKRACLVRSLFFFSPPLLPGYVMMSPHGTLSHNSKIHSSPSPTDLWALFIIRGCPGEEEEAGGFKLLGS